MVFRSVFCYLSKVPLYLLIIALAGKKCNNLRIVCSNLLSLTLLDTTLLSVTIFFKLDPF